jgi:hypothetical protein
MKFNHPLYEVLYVSTLAPDQDVTAVADIARHARVANGAANITGILVFDGMRFCEQLEGSQKQVLAMEQKIRADSRHIDMQVLHHGPLTERRFRCFTMGYSLLDDTDVLARLQDMDGQPAVDSFLALLPHLDLAP